MLKTSETASLLEDADVVLVCNVAGRACPYHCEQNYTQQCLKGMPFTPGIRLRARHRADIRGSAYHSTAAS